MGTQLDSTASATAPGRRHEREMGTKREMGTQLDSTALPRPYRRHEWSSHTVAPSPRIAYPGPTPTPFPNWSRVTDLNPAARGGCRRRVLNCFGLIDGRAQSRARCFERRRTEAKWSGRQDAVRTFSGRRPGLGSRLAATDVCRKSCGRIRLPSRDAKIYCTSAGRSTHSSM